MSAAPITVTAGFAQIFVEFCEFAGLDGRESQAWRESIRADFATVGNWIIESVAVYKFCWSIWGGLPRAEWCQGYRAGLGWFAEDEDIFKRQGGLALARLCLQVALQAGPQQITKD